MTRVLSKGEVEASRIVIVEGEELHYLASVRRAKVGDEVELLDASGRIFRARIERMGKREAEILPMDEYRQLPAPHPVTVMAAVPKGKLLDDAIRKLSELGVERFVPIICERSAVTPSDAKVERWRKIARESVRQCGRRAPIIIEPSRDAAAALGEALGTKRILLHPKAKSTAGDLLNSRGKGRVTVVVGPEGGFTDVEVEAARSAGFEDTSMGEFILRMETAIIVASIACIAYIGGFDPSGPSKYVSE